MYEVTASIVIYKNDSQELLRAISSFLNTDMNVKLFLIDNSPADDIKSVIPADKRIDYYFVGENLGFGKAHNIALEKAQKISKYHLILNPDIFFDGGVIEGLYAYMEANPNVGVSTPDIFLPDGSIPYTSRMLPSPMTLIKRRISPNSSKDIFTTITYDKPVSSPCISGCFMFVRTSILETVGMFDTRYFMYCEDLDFSRRVHSNNWDVVNYPMAKATHVAHRESAKSPKMLLIHMVSACKYFTKWGWFSDKEREAINNEAISKLNS